MPIATGFEEPDSDMVQVTPPTPEISLPNGKENGKVHQIEESDIKPSFQVEEKPEVTEKRQAVLDERQRQVDMAAKTIKDYRERLQDGVRPYAEKTKEFAERQPVLFTLIAIFIALSFIPIATFIGFLVSATVFIVGIAAVGICLSMLSCIVIASTILIPVLCFTTLVSLFLVYALVSLFLFYRLFLHVRANVSKPSGEVAINSESIMTGIRGWLSETEARAGFPPLPKALSPRSEKIELPSEDVDEKEGLGRGEQWLDEKVGFYVEEKPLLTGLGKSLGKEVEH